MSQYKPLTAQQARKLTDDAKSMEGTYLRDETNAITKAIENLATKGKCEYKSTWTDPIIVRRLLNMGYKVIETNDQRDGNYLTVSW